MKKLILTIALGVACVSALAQGTLNFANVGVGVNAPVYLETIGGAKLAGSAYLAQLFAGPSGTAESALVPIGNAVAFLSGAQAGYFTGGARTIDGVAGGAVATIQIRAWAAASGATWALASQNPVGVVGTSAIRNVTLATPPATPVNLTGLQSFVVKVVPEPSSFAVLGLGAAAMLIFRRRK